MAFVKIYPDELALLVDAAHKKAHQLNCQFVVLDQRLQILEGPVRTLANVNLQHGTDAKNLNGSVTSFCAE